MVRRGSGLGQTTTTQLHVVEVTSMRKNNSLPGDTFSRLCYKLAIYNLALYLILMRHYFGLGKTPY